MNKIEYVDIKDVPIVIRWDLTIKAIPSGQAATLLYNNRQRAHQMRNVILHAARKSGLKIHTRTIHIEDKWRLYIWKDD